MALPKCPPSPKELIAAAIAAMDPRGKYGAVLDEKIAEKNAANEGLLGSLLGDLLDQSAAFLAAAAGDLVNSLAAGALADIAGSLSMAGAILSLLVSMSMFGSSMGMMMQIMMAENMRKQVAIRLLWLNVVQLHYQEIYKLLRMIKQSKGTTPNYFKVMRALEHVKRAEKAIKDFQILEENSGTPRIKYSKFTLTYAEIDAALKILRSNPGDGTIERDLITGIQKGIDLKKIRKPGSVVDITKIKKATNNAFNAYAKEYKAKVLGRTLYIMEGLAWHSAGLLPPVPIPKFLVSLNATKLNGAAKLGYKGPKFDEDAADKRLHAIYKEGFKKYDAINKIPQLAGVPEKAAVAQMVLLQKLIGRIDEFDFQKGLVGTNLVIEGFIEAFKDFNSNWDQITKTSNFLLLSVMPIETGLTNTKESMQATIDHKDSEIIISMKEIMWVSTLSALSVYKSLIGDTLADQAKRADQAAELERIKAYLQTDTVQLAPNSETVTFIQKVIAIVPQALITGRALNEALVTVNLANTELKKYIIYNEDLYQRLGKVSLQNDPTAQNMTQLFAAMGLAGGVGGAMAGAMALGQLGQLANILAGVYAAMKGLDALGLPKCVAAKKSEDKETVACRTIEEKQQAFFA